MPYNYYPNYYGQPMQDNLSQLRNQYQPQDTRIWVQGEVGAKAYLVAQGSTVVLWDSESKTIFIKSGTANGVPVMQKLTYTIENEEAKDSINMSNYVTKEYLEQKLNELKEINNVSKQSNADNTAISAV